MLRSTSVLDVSKTAWAGLSPIRYSCCTDVERRGENEQSRLVRVKWPCYLLTRFTAAVQAVNIRVEDMRDVKPRNISAVNAEPVLRSSLCLLLTSVFVHG